MLFDSITDAVPRSQWRGIVDKVNAHFGVGRRIDNVKAQWVNRAKSMLLKGYPE